MSENLVFEKSPEVSPALIMVQMEEAMEAKVFQVSAVIEPMAADVTAFIAALALPAIKDQASYDIMVDSGKQAKAAADDLEELRTSFTKPINDGLRRINDIFKPVQETLKRVVEGVRKNAVAYQQEQENIRIEAQRKAEAEAQKERDRIAAEARKKREAEEKARLEAEEAEKRVAAARNAEERQKAEAEAAKARAREQAAAAAAETKEQIAETVVAPVIAPTVNKGGVYGSDKWTVEIKSKKDFIQWAIAHDSLEYVLVDEKLLTKEAQATKGVRQWPGAVITKSYGGGIRK